MPRTVLVVGVARPLGARLAARLQADPLVDTVIGVDAERPVEELPGVKFVHADLAEMGGSTASADRPPALTELSAALTDFAVDTVVHLGLVSMPGTVGGRSTMKELNVLGTMQLLAACQHAPSVRRLVVKSSSSIYGSSPRDPALFTEDLEAAEPVRHGFARDSLEVEGYVRGFARRRPDVQVTTLRMANVVGPSVDSPLTSYFTLPVWPTPMGHDARLQLLYEDDALDVLRITALQPVDDTPQREPRRRQSDLTGPSVPPPATYNVAGPGVLMLSQAARRAGRPTFPVPTPLAGMVGAAFQRAGVADFSPEQMRFLSYGRVLDCGRIERELGFVPAKSTAEAFTAFLADQRIDRFVPEDLGDQLLAILRAMPHAASWLPRQRTAEDARD